MPFDSIVAPASVLAMGVRYVGVTVGKVVLSPHAPRPFRPQQMSPLVLVIASVWSAPAATWVTVCVVITGVGTSRWSTVPSPIWPSRSTAPAEIAS